MKTAKIFRTGGSQAVRLPRDFRLEGDEVVVRKHGSGILLLPGKITYERVKDILGRFKGRIEIEPSPPDRRDW